MSIGRGRTWFMAVLVALTIYVWWAPTQCALTVQKNKDVTVTVTIVPADAIAAEQGQAAAQRTIQPAVLASDVRDKDNPPTAIHEDAVPRSESEGTIQTTNERVRACLAPFWMHDAAYVSWLKVVLLGAGLLAFVGLFVQMLRFIWQLRGGRKEE